MRVQMRKCPFTGKIFDESRIGEYIWHLKETRDAMRQARKLKNIKDTFFEWLKAEKLKITHPNQVIDWFMENQRYIMDAHNAGCRPKNYHGFDSDKFYPTDSFKNVRLERIPVFSDMVSNSHSCPDDGEQNFSGDRPGVPTGYPGWTGYIRGTLSREKKNMHAYPYSAALNLVGIKTGSGGGGNENWGYDFRLWLSDWPGFGSEYEQIMEQRRLDAIEAAKRKYAWEQEEIIRRLKGKR